MGEEILNILEGVVVDDSIETFQYIEKDTDQGTGALNNQTELTITFQNQDGWMYPHKSYLIIEGTITTALPTTAAISYVNNGIMFMFSNCKYFLGTQQVEYFENAGITTTINKLLTKSKNYQGLNEMWLTDTWSNTADNNSSSFAIRHKYIVNSNTWNFSVTVPFSSIFNFCNDYDKVLYGLQHKISMARTTDTRAIFRSVSVVGIVGQYPALTTGGAAGVANDVTINLSKLRWAMPYITPSSDEQMKLMGIIQQKIPAPLAFLNKRSDSTDVPTATTFNWRLQLTSGIERPKYIVFGFQTGRGADQTTNSALFDGVALNVVSAYVTLNGIRYPYADVSTDMATNKYSKWYRNYLEFFNYYHGNKNTNEACLSYIDFIACYPIYVFDVSNQPEKLRNTTIDTTLQMTFGAAAPANTMAYVVMYYDSLFSLTGDSNKQIIQIT